MLFSSTSECFAWLAVFMTEAFAIVTLNIITIIVLMKNQSLRKRSMYLVINLAVADMLVGGFSEIMTFFVMGIRCNFWKDNVHLNGIWDSIIYSLELLFPLTSILNIAAISLERTHATFLPFRHRVIRKMVYVVIIIIIWVTAAMVSIALVIIKNFKGHTKYYFYVYVSFNSICLFVIFVSYASIFMKMYCGAHPRHHGPASRERKLSVSLFIVTLVSLLMWLPYVISIFLFYSTEIFSSFPMLTNARFFFSLFLLFYTNSLVNPILYAIRMPEFKRALVSLFRFQQRQGVGIPLRPL